MSTSESTAEEESRPHKRQKLSHEPKPPRRLSCNLSNQFFIKKGCHFTHLAFQNGILKFVSDDTFCTGELKQSSHPTSQKVVITNTIPFNGKHNVCVTDAEIFFFYKSHVKRFNLATSRMTNEIEHNEVLQELQPWYKTWLAGYDKTTQKIVLVCEGSYAVYNCQQQSWDIINKPPSTQFKPQRLVVRSKTSQVIAFGDKGELMCYDIRNDTWSLIEVNGHERPTERLRPAFCMGPMEDYAVLYGGCKYETCFTSINKHDLWAFHFENMQWTRIRTLQSMPKIDFPTLCCTGGNQWIVANTTAGATLTIDEIASPSIDFCSAGCVSNIYIDGLLSDVKVLLKGEEVKAHYFVMAAVPFLKEKMIKDPTTLQYTLDLTSLNVSSAVLKERTLPTLYDQDTQIYTETVLEEIAAAEMIGFEFCKDGLLSQLERLLQEDDGDIELVVSLLQNEYRTVAQHLLIDWFATKPLAKTAKVIEEVQNRKIDLPQDLLLQMWRASVTRVETIPETTADPTAPDIFAGNYDVYLSDREETVKVGTYKALLCCASDYFTTLFTGNFEESEDFRSGSNTVKLNSSAKAIATFINVFHASWKLREFDKISGDSNEEKTSILIEVIRLSDELLMEKDFTYQIVQAVCYYGTPEQLLELYNYMDSVEVWNEIMNTYDSEDIMSLYNKRAD